MTVFTISISLLAWRNRAVVGMRWFAAGLIVGLIKLILQGLEGEVPSVFGSMLSNELYLVSSLLQLVGLHWFVIRKPFLHRWPFVAVAMAVVAYTAMYLSRIPYSANLINIPNVAVCAAASWMLVTHGQRAVSRVAAVILAGQAIGMGYRAWLTNIRYMRPWETVHAQTDPRWLYSLALLAFLATCLVMCDLWYLVTELGRELAEQARTDSLTGALNRRAIEEIALRETARSIRHGHPLCMVVLDVDHFKHLNDTRGHAAGDFALQALVQRVKSMLRKNDQIARTGGEEFTILLPDTSASAGVLAADRLRQAIEELEPTYENAPLRFTVSAGVAQFDAQQGSWETMMRRADSAMYEAKEHGRNAVWPALESSELKPAESESLPA